jgi:hypothetical protein
MQSAFEWAQEVSARTEQKLREQEQNTLAGYNRTVQRLHKTFVKQHKEAEQHSEAFNRYLHAVTVEDRIGTNKEDVQQIHQKGMTSEEAKRVLAITRKREADLERALAARGRVRNSVKIVSQEHAAPCEKITAQTIVADQGRSFYEYTKEDLSAAKKHLTGLRKQDLTEIKSMSNPPKAIKTTMEAVCIIFGKPQYKDTTSWKSSKQLLSQPNVLRMFMEFDYHEVRKSVLQKLEPYIGAEEFSPPNIAAVSNASHGLCMWVHAVYALALSSKMPSAPASPPEPPGRTLISDLTSEHQLRSNSSKQQQTELAQMLCTGQTDANSSFVSAPVTPTKPGGAIMTDIIGGGSDTTLAGNMKVQLPPAFSRSGLIQRTPVKVASGRLTSGEGEGEAVIEQAAMQSAACLSLPQFVPGACHGTAPFMPYLDTSVHTGTHMNVAGA